MKHYPGILALFAFFLVVTSLINQENPKPKDKGIRVGKTGEKTAFRGTLLANPPYNLTALSPLSTGSETEPASQTGMTGSLSLFDRLEEPSKPAARFPEKSFTKAVLNRTAIRVNWKALRDIRESGSGILEIDSGSGRLSAQVAEIIDNPGGGYSLSGDIAGDPHGTFLATVHEDALVASITTTKGLPGHFAIAMNAAGVHEVQQIDPTHAPVCGGPLQAPPGIGADEFRPGQGASKGEPGNTPRGHRRKDNHQTIVDIMILYTEEGRNDRGGENATIAAANQAINWTNQAFRNSGVDLAFRLAHTQEITYSETDDHNIDFDRLRDPSDGFMDEVHDLRNTYAADIVSLWLRGDGWGGIGGIGSYPSMTDASGQKAFNLCRIGSSKLHSTFAHECGHNMGCGHARAQDTQPGPGIFDYAAGWRWTGDNGTQWRSIMTYSPGSKIQNFSNPDITHDGVATGTATDDNARTLRETKSLVEGFRLADDHGNSTATATLISQDSTTAGYIGTQNDIDYFRINVTRSGTLHVLTTGITETFGSLLDPSGSVLAVEDFVPGPIPNFGISQWVSPGTYHVSVESFARDTGPYQLLSSLTPVEISPPQRSVDAENASFNFAVDASSDVLWTVESLAPWINIVGTDSGSGNGNVSYTLTGNTGFKSREGKIRIHVLGIKSPKTLILPDSNVNYLIPQDNSLGDTWQQPNFDETSWENVPHPVGFETPGSIVLPLIATDISADMKFVNSGAYFRFPFQVDTSRSRISSAVLNVTVDDGYVAYLNGVEVARLNAPEPLSWDSPATAPRGDIAVLNEKLTTDISAHLDAIVDGENVLAVHAFNTAPSGSDFIIGVELLAEELQVSESLFHTVTQEKSPLAGTVSVANLSNPFTQVQASGIGIRGGFVALGTTSLTDDQLRRLILSQVFSCWPVESYFTQFGTSGTFSSGAANNLEGYFALQTSATAGAAPFTGNSIYLIGGNGSGIADSGSLFVMRYDQVFTSSMDITLNFDDGELIWGAPGGTNSVVAGFPVIQMDSNGPLTPTPCELLWATRINQAGNQEDPTSNDTVNFTVFFDNNVSGFTGSDIDLSQSTAPGNLVAVVTGGPDVYNVAVSGMAGNGSVIARIAEGAANIVIDGLEFLDLPTYASSSEDNVINFQFVPQDTLALSPVSRSIGAGGGNVTFNVSSNTTWNWSDNAAWLTGNENTTQGGNQSFSYSVAANTSAQARSATITITTGDITRTHTLNQEGAANTLELKITTSITPRWGGVIDQFTMSFPASSSEIYSIEASTDLKAWVTIETGITGNGKVIERSYQAVGALRSFGYFRVRRE